jgi:transcriptional regulator with XRE-family HTH domain
MQPETPMRLVREELSRSFAEAKLRNPAYSLRAFSRRTGVGHSALSEILNGKRAVSAKLARRISARLALDPASVARIDGAFANRGRRAGPEDRAAIQLNSDQFQVIASWFHFAILSLAETEGFASDASWIAARLRISEGDARAAIERLLRLEMLARDSMGRYIPTGKRFTTTDGIASTSIRRSHAQDTELARRSLEQDSVEIRYFTSMTMTLDPDRLEEAGRELQKFRERFCSRFESGARKEVYKLTLGFFPLSRPLPKKVRKK